MGTAGATAVGVAANELVNEFLCNEYLRRSNLHYSVVQYVDDNGRRAVLCVFGQSLLDVRTT